MADVRIIGGELRGRKIQLAKNSQLRPTMSRVRETLFNWLSGELYDKRCLDAFAGTGVLGFEALSRGAKHVVFFERHKPTSHLIHKNIQQFQLEQVTSVKTVDACVALKKKAEEPFDIVFLDPPFNQGLLYPVLELLERNQYLKSGSWIYIEVESSLDFSSLSKDFILQRQKSAGEISYALVYKK